MAVKIAKPKITEKGIKHTGGKSTITIKLSNGQQGSITLNNSEIEGNHPVEVGDTYKVLVTVRKGRIVDARI
jgi:hypothetical protein